MEVSVILRRASVSVLLVLLVKGVMKSVLWVAMD